MPYDKGDFTQQGINGDVSALVRLNEKRVMKVVLSSDDESDNCDISGKVYDLLNDTSYNIGSTNPTGNIAITENGTGIDVSQYATASVAVPNPSTGKINITTLDEVNVTDYAAAQVVDANLTAGNIKKDVDILGVTGSYEGEGGATWTTVVAEQTGTTVYNSGLNMYFLQLSDVTDFGSPVIKVTLDSVVYYCFWDVTNQCWRDTMGNVIVAATIYNNVAYWGVSKTADTGVTTHTAKIEADTSYTLLFDQLGTGKSWFFTTDIGSPIPSPVNNPEAIYGCTVSTYMGVKIIAFTGSYAVVTEGIS